MITLIYRVSVDTPEEVWERFGGRQEYEQAVLCATEGHLSAGTNSYSEIEEWAEFPTLATAQQCEKNLYAMIASFKEKMDEDQNQ